MICTSVRLYRVYPAEGSFVGCPMFFVLPSANFVGWSATVAYVAFALAAAISLAAAAAAAAGVARAGAGKPV